MEDKIRHLDDATAIRLLSDVAQLYARAGGVETRWTPELRRALMEGSGVSGGAAPVSEGELARQTLLLLAEDASTRDALEARLEAPATRSFGVVTTVGVLAAVLVVLQIRFEVERDKEGKVTWKIGKEAADGTVLKALIEKVLSFPLGK